MNIRAGQQRTVEAGRFVFRQFADRIHAVDADADDVSRLKALTFCGAHATQHGVVVHADNQPVFDFRMLNQQGVTGVKRARDIVGFGRHLIDLSGRETGCLQRVHRAAGTTTGGIELVGRNRHHAGGFHIPAALLHLFIEFLTLTLTNFGRRHHHQRHGVHRFAFGRHELIVNRDDLQAVAARFRHNGRAEFRIGRTDHKTFCTVGRKAVDGIQGLFPIRHGNFDDVKAKIFARLIGEFPFRLEPGFFWLLD